MSWTAPGHIDPELWGRVSDTLREACFRAHDLIETGGFEEKLEALGMVPFWMVTDCFGVARSERREDYPHLDDAHWANFREVAVGRIAPGRIYRSSSPLWTRVNRQDAADEAARAAGVETVVDIAEDFDGARAWDGFDNRYCAGKTLLCQRMTMFFMDEEQRNLLARALRFIIDNPGPYLLFCMEGQDRTGYVCGILECFMGASVDEVVEDYLESFRNYYGLCEGGEAEALLERFFLDQLETAFGVNDLRAVEAQGELEAAAANFLQGIGLSDEELGALRQSLGS